MLRPNLESYLVILQYYQRRSDSAKCKTVLSRISRMTTRIPLEAYRNLLTLYLRLEKFKRAEETLRRLKDSVTPDIGFFDPILSPAEGLGSDAVKLVFGWIQEEKLVPSTDTYSHLIQSMHKNGENVQALKYFEAALEGGIILSGEQHFEAYKTALTLKDWHRAEAIFYSYLNLGDPTPEFLDAVFELYTDTLIQTDKAKSILEVMRSQNFPVKLGHLNSLLSMYRILEDQEKIEATYRRIKKDFSPDNRTYVEMLGYLLKTSSRPRTARDKRRIRRSAELYYAAKIRNFGADRETLRTISEIYKNLGLTDKFEEVVKEYENRFPASFGLQVSEVQAHIVAGNPDAAQKALQKTIEEFPRMGVDQPQVSTKLFEDLFKLMVKKCVGSAHIRSLLITMIRAKVQRNSEIFRLLQPNLPSLDRKSRDFIYQLQMAHKKLEREDQNKFLARGQGALVEEFLLQGLFAHPSEATSNSDETSSLRLLSGPPPSEIQQAKMLAERDAEEEMSLRRFFRLKEESTTEHPATIVEYCNECTVNEEEDQNRRNRAFRYTLVNSFLSTQASPTTTSETPEDRVSLGFFSGNHQQPTHQVTTDNIGDFNAVLSTLSDEENFEKVTELWTARISRSPSFSMASQEPNAATYSLALQAYCRLGLETDVCALLDKMEHLSILPPLTVCFSGLLSFYVY